jgi:hypothetical protein
VVYLVRSYRTYARIRSLTTGTFNLVVKDRIAFRLSGAPSGLDGSAARANPAVLETLQTYSRCKTLSIRASHSISTRFPHWEKAFLGEQAGSLISNQKARSTQPYVPSAWDLQNAKSSAHAKAEDRKLRKDLALGGPCFEGTLQKPTSVSESSPVAGTT